MAKTVAVAAFPFKTPIKFVEVIEVAPVTTPASILIVLSKTIFCPATGIIFKLVPPVVEIVLPLKLILSTCKFSNVPTLLATTFKNSKLPSLLTPIY